jgi:PAS domain S-box-containing protein
MRKCDYMESNSPSQSNPSYPSEQYYRALFTSMEEGFCVVEVNFDEHNKPIDYCFVEVNPAFEKQTGLSHVEGKCMRQLIPDQEHYWFEKYGEVALTGKPVHFESCSKPLNRCFYVHAFRVGDPHSRRVAILFNDISQRRKAEEALKEMTKSLEKRIEERTRLLEDQAVTLKHLAVELTHVEQNERKRLAEILHDHIQQLLVAAKIRLNVLERKSHEGEKKEIHEANTFIDQAFEASRSLTTQLSPPALYQEGLKAALNVLARKIEAQYKVKVNLNIDLNAEPQEFVRIIIYQCVQELLFNVVKYAKVDNCHLRIKKFNDNIVVEVNDKGIGFEAADIDKKSGTGFGLFSIRERVKVLGGKFTITSSPGKGSEAKIVIPDNIKNVPQK